MPGRRLDTKPETSKRMSEVRRRDTMPELAVRREVHRRGMRYFVDRAPSSSARTRADLLFPKSRVAVFIDGCFWHRCPDHYVAPKANAAWWDAKIASNVKRDAEVSRSLEQAGWTVVRAWEHERPNCVADRIEAAVKEATS